MKVVGILAVTMLVESQAHKLRSVKSKEDTYNVIGLRKDLDSKGYYEEARKAEISADHYHDTQPRGHVQGITLHDRKEQDDIATWFKEKEIEDGKKKFWWPEPSANTENSMPRRALYQRNSDYVNDPTWWASKPD